MKWPYAQFEKSSPAQGCDELGFSLRLSTAPCGDHNSPEDVTEETDQEKLSAVTQTMVCIPSAVKLENCTTHAHEFPI